MEELYDFVRHAHQQEVLCNEKVQHTLLVPTLRPYQRQAVNWMLQKENYFVNPSSDGKFEMDAAQHWWRLDQSTLLTWKLNVVKFQI